MVEGDRLLARLRTRLAGVVLEDWGVCLVGRLVGKAADNSEVDSPVDSLVVDKPMDKLVASSADKPAVDKPADKQADHLEVVRLEDHLDVARLEGRLEDKEWEGDSQELAREALKERQTGQAALDLHLHHQTAQRAALPAASEDLAPRIPAAHLPGRRRSH